MKTYHTIDEYIAQFPASVQATLQRIRQTIHQAAPQAEEAIAYGIPTFKQNGNLVHFGGYQTHIGFYPAPSGIAAFASELAQYGSGKGSIHFPLDQPIPYELLSKIVQYRLAENMAKKKKS